MAALLCVFIVFAKTLGIIYGCGPPWKRVSPLNIQFCQKKFYLIFDYWLSVKAIFDNFKEVWLELNNELIYEFYYARLFIQTDTQFCSLCWRITKIGMGHSGIFIPKKKRSSYLNFTHRSFFALEIPQNWPHSVMLPRHGISMRQSYRGLATEVNLRSYPPSLYLDAGIEGMIHSCWIIWSKSRFYFLLWSAEKQYLWFADFW